MPFAIGPKVHNVIPKSLKGLIEAFFSLIEWKDLYLTGGTCLAEYYFGHRISADMDLFAQNREAFQEAIKAFQDPASLKGGSVDTKRLTPHLAQFLFHPNGAAEPIKVDLMLDIATHIAAPIRVGPVWIDSLEDLLINKLGCLVQRNDVKDFIDLFYLIPSSNLTAKELIELGSKKGGGLDPLIAAQQIDFIFHEPPPEKAILGRTNWNELQLFFKKFQKECLDVIRP